MSFRSHHPSRRSRTSMAMIAQRCDPTSFVNVGSRFTMAIWVETHPFGFGCKCGCKWTITLNNQNQQQMIFLVNYYSLILRVLHIFWGDLESTWFNVRYLDHMMTMWIFHDIYDDDDFPWSWWKIQPLYPFTSFWMFYDIDMHGIYTNISPEVRFSGPDREAPEVVWNTSSYI